MAQRLGLSLTGCNTTAAFRARGRRAVHAGRTFGDHRPLPRRPALLPRLVPTISSHHPAFSSCSRRLCRQRQPVAACRRARAILHELGIALDRMRRNPTVARVSLGQPGPFLDRPATHICSRLNIEKLWNPHLPGRGCLGLVEFRGVSDAVSRPTGSGGCRAAASRHRDAVGKDIAPGLRDWGDALRPFRAAVLSAARPCAPCSTI